MSPPVSGIRTSYSRLSTWLRCPRKYRYRYLDEAPEERTPCALVFGTAIHEGCEALLKSLPGGNPASLDEILGVFTRAMTDSAQLAQEHGIPIDWGDGSLEQMLEKGEQMLAVFHERVDRRLNVVATELAFEVELAPGRHVQGVIDLVLSEGKGRFRVVDLKTAASTYGPDRLELDLQPTVYIAAAEKVFNAPGSVDFEFWLLTKTRQPDLKILPVVRNARDHAELLESIDEVEQACLRGVFPRLRSYACFGCEYEQRCSLA